MDSSMISGIVVVLLFVIVCLLAICGRFCSFPPSGHEPHIMLLIGILAFNDDMYELLLTVHPCGSHLFFCHAAAAMGRVTSNISFCVVNGFTVTPDAMLIENRSPNKEFAASSTLRSLDRIFHG